MPAIFLAYAEKCPLGLPNASCGTIMWRERTPPRLAIWKESMWQRSTVRGGIAKALLAASESWAKSRGCTEFASDCELENTQSLQFHLNVGFEEANRIICFTKKL